MAQVCRCSKCIHFKQKDAPQGTCEAHGLPTLAWCGCTYDFLSPTVPNIFDEEGEK